MLAHPKEKKERALGIKLFVKGERCLSAKCAAVRNAKRPGIHGASRRSLSEYGRQLIEKQKIKAVYGIKERQLSKYFAQAIKSRTSTDDKLLNQLEQRLDNVVYQSGFAISRSVAKHLINHGHFLVNKRKVNIPSYSVAIKDIIEIKPSSKELKVFEGLREKLKRFEGPDWIKLNPQDLTIEVIKKPASKLENLPFNTKLVIEFLNR